MEIIFLLIKKFIEACVVTENIILRVRVYASFICCSYFILFSFLLGSIHF